MTTHKTTYRLGILALACALLGFAGMPARADVSKRLFAAIITGTPEEVASLVAQGADVNARVGDGATPLMAAAGMRKDPGIVLQLLEFGANPSLQDKNGTTALTMAAFGGNLEIVNMLLKAGADVNAGANKNTSALLTATQMPNPNPDVIKRLLDVGANVRVLDTDGKTALHYARGQSALQGTSALRQLESLSRGPSKSSTPPKSRARKPAARAPRTASRTASREDSVSQPHTLSLWATARDGTPEALARLIKAGGDARARRAGGVSVLMWAAGWNKNPESVRQLVRAGASLRARDKHGRTALMIAAQVSRHPLVIEALLKLGASARARDWQGRTVADYASRNGALKNTEVLGLLKAEGVQALPLRPDGDGSDPVVMNWLQQAMRARPNAIARLLARGADVRVLGPGRSTVLMAAASLNPNVGVIRHLIDAGVDVNAQDDKGSTALMGASVLNRNPEIVAYLIQAGADVNARDLEGRSALMAAALNPDSRTLKHLLRAGANPRVRDVDGQTALMIAAGAKLVVAGERGPGAAMMAQMVSKNPDFIRLLLKAGADAKARDKNGKTALDYARNNLLFKYTDALRRLEQAMRK